MQNCNSVLCAGLLLLQLLELAAEFSVSCTGVTLGKLSGRCLFVACASHSPELYTHPTGCRPTLPAADPPTRLQTHPLGCRPTHPDPSPIAT